MKLDQSNKSSRRGFLGAVASGAAALGVTTLANPLQATAGAFRSGPGVEEWFKKIKGKHKIAFDAPEFNEGMPLAFPRVFQITNQQNGTDISDLGIVVILRHNGLPLALDSKLWSKYKLGELFNIKDHGSNKPAERNMFWKAKQGELELPGMGIDELQQTGALFCVCEMAIFHYSGIAAKKAGLDHETVRKEWMAGILPGIQPVPSGVFAVNRSQEHGCTYCFAG
jgi:intracellular sulfur oxidation DsrE/DsrF family protein